MRVGLVSAKGSPGVTTAALVLAAAGEGLLVEADPSGGSVECWLGPAGEPGLIRLASALRRSAGQADALDAHATAIRSGLSGVLAPTSGVTAESALVAIGDRLVPVLTGFEGLVVVDGGRWSRTQTTARRLAGCDVIGLVCSPTLAAVESTRAMVVPLAEMFGVSVRVIVVGDRPYEPAEVEPAVGASVVGVLAWERRSVQALLASGPSKGWQRTALARSARGALANLETAILPPVAVADD